MDAPARLQRGVAIGHFVAPSLDNTSRRAVGDANGFVEVVKVRRQSAAGLEQTVAAAHFDAGHEVLVEMIDETGSRPGLKSRRVLEMRNPFLSRNPAGILRHDEALEGRGNQLASRRLRGE